MVPRRAPLRSETIPADVCASENNEWRGTGFFWDLLDLHNDGESMEQGFAALWNPLQGSRVPSTTAAAQRIQSLSGVPSQAIRQVWLQNFLK
ncbi:MAG: hypothetical protein RJB38_665 [Pseudomonadota bacterium]|jgi:hypothetical protein